MLGFLLRDAMRNRGICCRLVSVRLSLCPSVRPSVTFVYCTQTAEDIVKLLCWPGSPIILSFWPQAPIPNFKGTHSAGRRIHVGGKKLRFSTDIAVYLGNGTRYTHGCYGTLIGSHRWWIDPCRFRWPWVTLKGWIRGPNFSGGSP